MTDPRGRGVYRLVSLCSLGPDQGFKRAGEHPVGGF
jgi:hypothetical protein